MMPVAAIILDGKATAATIKAELATRVAALKQVGVHPGLGTILVGDDPGSHSYVGGKHRDCAEVGIASIRRDLAGDASQDDVERAVRELNDDPACTGYIVQLPLPKGRDPHRVLALMDPDKDADGLHPMNLGRLVLGEDAPLPCTPRGIVELLRRYDVPIGGAEVVVVGRSNIVGKPIANLLLAENCTVTIAHSKTRDLPSECRQADILVAAVGRARMVRGDWIKPGATVIDVGINRIPSDNGKTRLVGDVDFNEALEVAGAITPVPGGVGPMTVACLLRNTLVAACRQRDIAPPEL